MSLTTINNDNIFKKGVIGNVRKAQEDSHDMAIMTPNGDVFVVCDGMGGHVGGAKASSIAVSSIIEYLKKEKYNDIPQALNEAIQYANMQIIGFASANPEFKGMGTTACIVVLQEKEAYIAHVGDSRIYLYLGKEKQLHRITKDHSYVQTLVDAGQISDDEAEHHPNKNRILKALGIRPDMSPTVDVVHPKNGDTFLICTDGLNGMICDNTILQVMKQDVSLEKKGELLINLAMQGEPGYPGGQDNCTLELINIDNSPWQKSEFTSFNPKPKVKPSSKPNTGDQRPKDPGTSEKTPSFSLKKLAFILVPLVLILACVFTIPVITANKNEERLNEFNDWIGKNILNDSELSKPEKDDVNEKINRDFGNKEKFDKIYKESKKKDDYSNIKLYQKLLNTYSKAPDNETPPTSKNIKETNKTENKTKEEDKSKINKQEESKEMPSPNSQDNNSDINTLHKSFKRDGDIPFGIKSIELKVGKYEITFINRDKFYPQHICDLFNVKVDDFLEWNDYESANNVGGNGTELKIIKDEGYFWYKLHKVKKDEILNDISETYNVKIEDIQNCNGIKDPKTIQPEQELIIITIK